MLRSNCYVLDLPGTVVVIDPVNAPAVSDVGQDFAVREALEAGSKPVIAS